MMNQSVIEKITELRRALHDIPEISGQEVRTKEKIKDFLRKETSFPIYDCGEGFYAVYREDGAARTIALRADYDALAMPDGTAAHLCGHDGHAAALCGVALMLEKLDRKLGRSVILLFQPAEETGAGASACCHLFDMERVDEIYGAHNLPGFPFGKVYSKYSTFACGSEGMTLWFTGKPTHAAYPELGISPALAVGTLLTTLPSILQEFSDPTVRCTVIGVHMGEKAFGAAAEKGEVWLTLRAEHEEQLRSLHSRILEKAEALAASQGLAFAHEEQDIFPATENHDRQVDTVFAGCHAEKLQEPMRWSEDFGHYLLHIPGAFFGIGAGENHPGLHTACYEYPDSLLALTAEAFMSILSHT